MSKRQSDKRAKLWEEWARRRKAKRIIRPKGDKQDARILEMLAVGLGRPVVQLDLEALEAGLTRELLQRQLELQIANWLHNALLTLQEDFGFSRGQLAQFAQGFRDRLRAQPAGPEDAREDEQEEETATT